MKRVLLSCLLAIVASVSAHSAEWSALYYPTPDDASFVISVPDNWELKQAEAAGDYFDLIGPKDATFSFRTIKGTAASLNEAIDKSIADVGEKFKDVKMGEPADWTPNGLQGIFVTGTAKDEDGVAVTLGLGWCALEDGKIAEFWFVANLDDDSGIGTAEKIANSMKAP